MLFAGLNIFAQDIIITNDEQRIEAKISEVSETSIKYKEIDNLDGPTFVLSVDKINTIIYSNGKVKIFEHPASSEIVQQTKQQATTMQSNAMQTSEPIKTVTYDSRGRIITYYSGGNANSNVNHSESAATNYQNFQGGTITYLGGNQWKLNGTTMNEGQYLKYLQNNCYAAYESHVRGQRFYSTGIVIGVLGCAALLTGGICYGVGKKQTEDATRRYGTGNYSSINEIVSDLEVADELMKAGKGLMYSGSAVIVISIPFTAVGAYKINHSNEVYNMYCQRHASNKTTPKFNIGIGANSVGLALNW